MKKLAIVVTHPIQYLSPVFKMLTDRGIIKIKVFYTLEQAKSQKFDVGFNKIIDWNIPLLDGYDYHFEKNIAKKPGDFHFMGIQNPELIKNLEEWQADAILVIGWNYLSHLKAIRYFKGKIPVYFKGDSHLLNEKPGIKKYLRRAFLRWVYSFVDKAFYVGESNKDYFKIHGFSEDQLIFAPHAIDNTRFQENDTLLRAEALSWRRKMGIPKDDIVYLFVGKLTDEKNVALLIRAFLKLNPSGSHLMIVGNGQLEPELKAKANNHKRIHFIPFQDQANIPLVYRLGNVFVLPSKSETWGLVVNEAMACGLPIIVSDKVGSARNLVDWGKNGCCFKENDVNDLAEKLNCMNNPSKIMEMGKISLEKIKDYSFEILASSIEAEITRL